ncbi:uncharacterized protein DSM5745_03173 [Aspergillus mulundensis]|uniref:DUF7730 domain-containing protein n=1 Tax=Aspergillus mulundensis TaxID=1810919 RepID=A0A3D8SK28_9EURO|nr:hypothetical protein DSM5745_03173 [Aspergillus mulundensis]RDW86531.1 hypothetical protein DSM5745_03173 [Aspergillus mulundensis]
MAFPFRKRDIEKAFFGLDLNDDKPGTKSKSSSASTNAPKPKQGHRNPLETITNQALNDENKPNTSINSSYASKGTTKLKTTNKAPSKPSSTSVNSMMSEPALNTPPNTKPDQTFNFLGLPLEVRRRVYNFLLFSRHSAADIPKDRARITSEKLIFLEQSPPQDLYQPGKVKSLHTAILRTCKQIHSEAAVHLYRDNSFMVPSPIYMLRFFKQVGATNTKHLKKLSLTIQWNADRELKFWLLFLKKLAKDASGLETLTVVWIANTLSSEPLSRGARGRGLGDNVTFVRALARVKQVTRLNIFGFYAKNWLTYLKREMEGAGVQVQEAGQFGAVVHCDLVELLFSRVREFQEGTEDIWP